MRIYVCWDTAAKYPVMGDHPCGIAYHALLDAGHRPEVKKAYGWEKLPGVLNATSGRKAVRELTGSYEVPVIVLDDGEVVADSKNVEAWAEDNPVAGGS